jgi:ABC-type antimicrobial peptide transport system permease subunit
MIIATAAAASSRVMALLLASVASISLLVGGISIMNMLLVPVTGRTREIGLRMAIGARRLHVLLQFLAEAVFVSGIGGIAGIIGGIAASEMIPSLADGRPGSWPPPLSADFYSRQQSKSFSATIPHAKQLDSIPLRPCATNRMFPLLRYTLFSWSAR